MIKKLPILPEKKRRIDLHVRNVRGQDKKVGVSQAAWLPANRPLEAFLVNLDFYTLAL